MVGNLVMQVWLQAFLQLNVTEVFRDKDGPWAGAISLEFANLCCSSHALSVSHVCARAWDPPVCGCPAHRSVILHALGTGLEASRHPSPMHSQQICAKLCIYSSGRCTPRYAQDAAQEIPVHLLGWLRPPPLGVSLQQVPNQTSQPYDKMGSTLALNSLRMQSKLEMPCRQHRCRTAKAALRALAHSCAMASLNPPCVSSERPRYSNWWSGSSDPT